MTFKSKTKVARSRDAPDWRCFWPISRKLKVLETSKFVFYNLNIWTSCLLHIDWLAVRRSMRECSLLLLYCVRFRRRSVCGWQPQWLQLRTHSSHAPTSIWATLATAVHCTTLSSVPCPPSGCLTPGSCYSCRRSWCSSFQWPSSSSSTSSSG